MRTLILAAHNPTSPSDDERRALIRIGRRLKDVDITHAAHSGCTSAKETLALMLRGADRPDVRVDALNVHIVADNMCCGCTKLGMLLPQVPEDQPVTVTALKRIDHLSTQVIASHTSWEIERWRGTSARAGTLLLTIDPITAALIAWNVCNRQYALASPLLAGEMIKITWNSSWKGNGPRTVDFPHGIIAT